MIRIYAAGAIYIDGWKTAFPATSLVARAAGDVVSIFCRDGADALVAARFDAIGRADASSFDTVDACLAYLAATFAQRADARARVETPIAATDLGGHRIVRAVGTDRVAYASTDDPDGIATVLGLTIQAAVAGAPLDVVTAGPVDEPGWAFTPGPVFLGRDGLLTQIAPETGVELRIGTASGPTRLTIAIGEPFFHA